MSATDHGWSHTGYRLYSKIHKEKLTIEKKSQLLLWMFRYTFWLALWVLPHLTHFLIHFMCMWLCYQGFQVCVSRLTKTMWIFTIAKWNQMEDKFEKQDGALRDWVSLQEIVTIFTNDQKASWHDWIGQIDRLVWVEYANPMLDSC